MRIDDKAQTGLNKLNDTSAKKKTTGVAGSTSDSSASSAVSGSDSVSLSDSAKDMAAISSGLQNAPEIRADVVANIKDRIASGQYNVSGRQVAEKIVQNAIDDTF